MNTFQKNLNSKVILSYAYQRLKKTTVFFLFNSIILLRFGSFYRGIDYCKWVHPAKIESLLLVFT